MALKLVMALGEKRYRALFQEYADLAAVGTVADVMKLLGENRTIVRVGLNHLKKTRRRGLYALMVEAGTLNRAITSTTVGYCLSPDQRRRPDGPGGDRGGAHPHRGQQPGRAAGPRAV
ncbi:MAG: hypothetical protein ACLT9P_00660 [Evtepia gabavorous]